LGVLEGPRRWEQPRLTKRHAERLGASLDCPTDLFDAVLDSLRFLLNLSALTFSADDVFRKAASEAMWPTPWLDRMLAFDVETLERVAIALIELRALSAD
jgi:hypothetical protein